LRAKVGVGVGAGKSITSPAQHSGGGSATCRTEAWIWVKVRRVRAVSDHSCRQTNLGPKVATFLLSLSTEACGTSRDGWELLARDRICSQVAWYRPYSEMYGFNPTRRSLTESRK